MRNGDLSDCVAAGGAADRVAEAAVTPPTSDAGGKTGRGMRPGRREPARTLASVGELNVQDELAVFGADKQ